MKTPIVDFVTKYIKSNTERMHMPGHKGAAFLGFENRDITEIEGADSLYEPTGIIKESEDNATKLFGSKRTLYSTEGSSQCIKAMIYLSLNDWKRKAFEKNKDNKEIKPAIIAGRNAHISFIHAVGLLDVEVLWLWPEENERENNICTCNFNYEKLESLLKENKDRVIGVYITSPDYLGQVQDLKRLSEIAHENATKLIVDNAHGAYFKFLNHEIYKNYYHPIDLGADLVCDSAHKTLPVLTGGAYLHISNRESDYILENAKRAMLIFGSTSPSYLVLQSLDMCNAYIDNDYEKLLKDYLVKLEKMKSKLKNNNWILMDSDPLKLTVRINDKSILKNIRNQGIEYEYADENFVVFMFTIENKEEGLEKIVEAFGKNNAEYSSINYKVEKKIKKTSIHDALFNPNLADNICKDYRLICPPAILEIVPGEEND